MNTEFIVTELGLQLDGRMLLPGSRLIVKNAPHPSWLNVGRVSGQVTEQKLVVASPASSALQELASEQEPLGAEFETALMENMDKLYDDAAPVPEPQSLPSREQLEADYEALFDKKPHHKMKDETIHAAIQEALGK